MKKTITRVEFEQPTIKKRLRVAAYARVSSGKDAMLHSLSAQVSHYSAYIQSHSEWEYVGVYSDEALTGTKELRDGFQRLLTDCREGKIDMVITKSISRFARNTVTLLEAVRELKRLGIDIFFEEQSIHTLSADGELMLTILASYAQEESLSVSENQKWRVRKNFEEGKPWAGRMLGYRYENGAFVVIPEEAEIVKKIFRYYLEGLGTNAIMKRLADAGINAKNGGLWGHSTLAKILRNYAYTGNLLLQRFYRENHLTKKTVVNNGELPKYQVNNSHEAIIDMDTFEAVQNEIARRAERYARSGNKERYPFSGLVVCGNCGKHFRRKVTPYNVLWICATYNEYGKAACESKAIPEATLTELVSDIPFSQISEIRALNGNTVIICKKDGSEITRKWQDRSRSESWTPEMKAEASKRNKKGERQWEQ